MNTLRHRPAVLVVVGTAGGIRASVLKIDVVFTVSEQFESDFLGRKVCMSWSAGNDRREGNESADSKRKIPVLRREVGRCYKIVPRDSVDIIYEVCAGILGCFFGTGLGECECRERWARIRLCFVCQL